MAYLFWGSPTKRHTNSAIVLMRAFLLGKSTSCHTHVRFFFLTENQSGSWQSCMFLCMSFLPSAFGKTFCILILLDINCGTACRRWPWTINRLPHLNSITITTLFAIQQTSGFLAQRWPSRTSFEKERKHPVSVLLWLTSRWAWVRTVHPSSLWLASDYALCCVSSFAGFFPSLMYTIDLRYPSWLSLRSLNSRCMDYMPSPRADGFLSVPYPKTCLLTATESVIDLIDRNFWSYDGRR